MGRFGGGMGTSVCLGKWWASPSEERTVQKCGEAQSIWDYRERTDRFEQEGLTDRPGQSMRVRS